MWCFLCSGVPIYSCYQLVNCGLYRVCAQVILSLPVSQQYLQMLMFTMALAQILLEITFCLFFLFLLNIFPKKKNNSNLQCSVTDFYSSKQEFSCHIRRKTHMQHHIEEVLVCAWKFVCFSSAISWPSECYNVLLLPQPPKRSFFQRILHLSWCTHYQLLSE